MSTLEADVFVREAVLSQLLAVVRHASNPTIAEAAARLLSKIKIEEEANP